uniref:Transmembrane protein n=1 Tax=Plectus sambesii TaxID=2011161 RepID=A0A914V1J4_9BILA
MTKIDLGTGAKNEKPTEPMDSVDHVAIDVSTEESEKSAQEEKERETAAKLHEILASIGMDVPIDTEPEQVEDLIGMDWNFIARISKTQLILSTVTMACLCISLIVSGCSIYRFTSTAWAAYLICTSFIGLRAGKWQSYSHIVAYTGMVTFQTFVYMSTMCWLLYTIYALDGHPEQHYGNEQRRVTDAVLFLTLGEVLALMGTILTSTLCRRSDLQIPNDLQRSF